MCIRDSWNPIDLGYAAVQLATRVARGSPAGPNGALPIGRLGTAHFDATGSGPMARPFIYDQSNVAKFAAIF